MQNTGIRREAKMRALVMEAETSGTPLSRIDAREGLSRQTLYTWRRHLRQAPPKSKTDLIPIRVISEPCDPTPIDLDLERGRRLVLRPGIDATHLCQVFEVLESC